MTPRPSGPSALARMGPVRSEVTGRTALASEVLTAAPARPPLRRLGEGPGATPPLLVAAPTKAGAASGACSAIADAPGVSAHGVSEVWARPYADPRASEEAASPLFVAAGDGSAGTSGTRPG